MEGRSGISHNQSYVDVGMRSHVSGTVNIDTEALIDRKILRFMGDASAYSYIAMQEAIANAGLTEDEISNERTGIVAGSGGGSPEDQLESTDILREKGMRRVGPYRIPRTMSSSVSACLATPFRIKGVNYSISSACATSAHCIGNGAELIQMGKQDRVFAGGGESEHWSMSHMFDAMGALSTKYNDTPDKASRAFDADRDGFWLLAVAAWSCWKPLRSPRLAAPESWQNSLVTVPPLTATTWWPHPAKVVLVPCAWPPKVSKEASTTLTLTVPALRPEMFPS